MKKDHMKSVKEIDDLLDTYTVTPASPELRQRIFQLSRQPSAWGELLAVIGGWQVAAPALAASLVLGVAVQLWFGQTATDIAANDSVWAMAMLEGTQEWDNE
jgi:hypothetical protein